MPNAWLLNIRTSVLRVIFTVYNVHYGRKDKTLMFDFVCPVKVSLLGRNESKSGVVKSWNHANYSSRYGGLT